MVVASGLVHALAYRRVSGAEHQKVGLSLEFQEKTLRQYVAQQPGWVLGGEYVDVLTGARDDRVAYQRMLDDVRRLRKTGERVAVVALRIDRFGRDLAEAARARKELRKLGVEQHACLQGGAMNSTLQAGMLMVLGQHEREVIAENVANIRRELIDDGWAYGRVAFGYRARPATSEEVDAGLARKLASGGPAKVFEPDPATASVAAEVFERVARGESVRSVARWLAGLPEGVRGGRTWPHRGVVRMLRSPTYIARAATGAADALSRPRARWLPIVSDVVWAAVQARLADHVVHPHEGAHSRFLLTGFIRCDVCGSRMVANTRTGSGKPGYRCTGRNAGAAAPVLGCSRVVSMAKLDAAVLAKVAVVLNAAHDPERLLAAERRLAQQASPDAGRARRLEAEVKEANQLLADAAELLTRDRLDADGYRALRDRHVARIEAAQEQLAKLKKVAPATSRRPLSDVLQGVWADDLGDAGVEQQRAVLRLLVETVKPVRVSYGTYDAEIAWTADAQPLATL